MRFFTDSATSGLRYSSYADYLRDPFKANEDRGDWGKCLPEELFGIMW